MKKEIKEKWIAALRSGDYPQDKHRAKTENGFCCLGVLTDIYLKENNLKWEDTTTKKDFSGQENECTYNDSIYLTSDVAKWASLKTPLGVYSKMNDFSNKTFAEIANFIEEKEI